MATAFEAESPSPEDEECVAVWIDPEDVATLLRGEGGRRRPAGKPCAITWYDRPDGMLAATGTVLAEQGQVWRAEKLAPGPEEDVLTLLPATAIGKPEGALVAIGAFVGTENTLPAEGGAAYRGQILAGVVRGITTEEPVARLILTGPANALATRLDALAESAALRLLPPSLAARAVAMARGGALAEPAGPASLRPDMGLGEACAHLLSGLTGEVVSLGETWREAPTAEAVHTLRVALRRLRAGLSILRRAAADGLDPPRDGLRQAASLLGKARDWDVLLEGDGAALRGLFPEDGRVTRLLGAAERQRRLAYDAASAYFASAEWRRLALNLALLPRHAPWRLAPAAPPWTEPASVFASAWLTRERHWLIRHGRHFADLPDEALHELRKGLKRFRYGAEFFAPLFPDRAATRFLRRLARAQAALGRVNDAAVAGTRLKSLAGSRHGFATGAALGYLAANRPALRQNAELAWKKLRREDAFWA